jgi:DNA-3-methyladenine glycosylase
MKKTAQPISFDFYQSTDVVLLARQLIGKLLITDFSEGRTAVRITETEAYRAPDDRACHAFGNRRTTRTETMFAAGGCAYIYLCYGIHHLFNVVTGPKDTAHAVLIRAGKPELGTDIMLFRRGKDKIKPNLTVGPGAMAQALGLHTRYDGTPLDTESPMIWLADDGYIPQQIGVGPRIGVDYAGDCAAWPWRFWDASAVGWFKPPAKTRHQGAE